MIFIVAVLVSGVVLAFSSAFHQSFFIVKLVILFLFSFLGVAILVLRQRVFLPSFRVIIFLAVWFMTVASSAAFSPAPRHAFLQLLFLFSGFLCYWFILNLSAREKNLVFYAIFILALSQVVILAFQVCNVIWLLPATLISGGGKLTGTVGNSEFLATSLGVAFFIALHLREKRELTMRREVFVAGLCALLVGIVLLNSKGTLIFITLYGLWRLKPDIKLFTVTAIVATVLVGVYFPTSIMGRLFLWLISLQMFIAHPLSGVGFGQFENNYLQTVYEMLSSWRGLSAYFGGYTSSVRDAHNLFLHNAAELGAPGLVLSIIFVGFVFSRAKACGGYLGAALFLLLYKSLYTVMLNSPTGLLLMAVLLAVMTNKGALRPVNVAPEWLTMAIPLVGVAFFSGLYFCRADYYYQKGLKAVLVGDMNAAVGAFTSSTTIDPENSDAYLGLAYAEFLSGQTVKMDYFIQRAMVFRKNIDIYKISAHMYFYSHLYDSADRLYSYLLVVFPEHLTSMGKLAIIASLSGNRCKAKSLAHRILSTKSRRVNDSDTKNIQIARKILREY